MGVGSTKSLCTISSTSVAQNLAQTLRHVIFVRILAGSVCEIMEIIASHYHGKKIASDVCETLKSRGFPFYYTKLSRQLKFLDFRLVLRISRICSAVL